MGLLDRSVDLDQRGLGTARIGPDEIADQHEIGAAGGEVVRLFERGGKADAGRLEQLGPPVQPLGDRLRRRALALCIRFAEQHVIRADLARIHGMVPRRQPADAGDAIGLERWQRLFQRGDAGQVRAVGAATCDQFGMAVDEQRGARLLDRRRQRLDARDHGALIGLLQPQQHGRDVGGSEQARQLGDEAQRDRRRQASRDRDAAPGAAEAICSTRSRLLSFPGCFAIRPWTPDHSCGRDG